MNKGHISACILAASVIVASSASADIYSDCEDAIERGDIPAVQEMASKMRTFNYVPVRRHTAANICVSEAMGTEMAFQLGIGQFIPLAELQEMNSQVAEARAAKEAEEKAAADSVKQRICELQEVVTETNQTLQLAEAAQQDRRIETLAVTIQECSAWFEDDARGALTNDVCNSIFASGGLPNSEISGPTTSEVLLAELINTNATTELEILVESGMLLETIATMAAEMGIFEGGDPYECDQ